MRRRRTLIDDYLREHNPVAADTQRPALADAGEPRNARANRWHRPPLLALGIATTLAAIALVAFMPGRATKATDSFLSPQAAVAAASAGLDRDGILHWTMRGGDGSSLAPGVQSIKTWMDLKTHAVYTVYPGAGTNQHGSSPRRSWYNGQRTYRVEWPAGFAGRDPRPVIVRTVRRRGERIPESTQITPIERLRDLLTAAAQGQATLESVPDEQGVPVVKVTKQTQFDHGTTTETTWMTREQTPRQLRTQSNFRWSQDYLASVTPNVRRRLSRVRETTMTFDTWELLPRTPENIAKVQPPEFDPDDYKVVTQFLGPPKR